MKHAAISKTQKLIITLRDDQKLSWSEISRQIGDISRGNCQKLYARAKRELAAREKLQGQIDAYADEGRRSVYAKRRRQLQRELDMAQLCDEGAEPPPKPERSPNPTSFGSPERNVRLEEFCRQREEESMPPPQSPPLPLVKVSVPAPNSEILPVVSEPIPTLEGLETPVIAKNGHSDVAAPHPVAPPPVPTEPNLLQAFRGEIGPADWWYANRSNKLVTPTKGEEPIRHASFCTYQCGGGCICDAGRGKRTNYNERF